ncbi:MAG: 4-hydroxy-tetrahydrodipicolinate synthase [Firmicutes bacterium]|nr:4-hydroxy-tetrahydrodipicolinate synthase [Bacillota bacterium]
MFGRLVTAMVTPFADDLRLDVSRLEVLVEHLLATGTTAIVVAGTTGESPTLTESERMTLCRETVRIVAGRVPVIAGTGSYSTAEAEELTREADEVGASAFLQVAPYYNKPSQEGLYRHFCKVAEVTNKPILLYNIPARTGVNLSVETIVRLSRVPNIVGVKESSGDFTQISRIISETPEDFILYSGDDKYTLPILALGGVGVVSVAAHVVGHAMTAMIEAFFSRDVQSAMRRHHELMPLFEELFRTSNPVMVKTALALIDVPAGGVRQPLVDATPEERRGLRRVLGQHVDLSTVH